MSNHRPITGVSSRNVSEIGSHLLAGSLRIVSGGPHGNQFLEVRTILLSRIGESCNLANHENTQRLIHGIAQLHWLCGDVRCVGELVYWSRILLGVPNSRKEYVVPKTQCEVQIVTKAAWDKVYFQIL